MQPKPSSPAALQVEMADHLGYERGDRAGHGTGNPATGSAAKALRTDVGEVRIEGPADRAGRLGRR